MWYLCSKKEIDKEIHPEETRIAFEKGKFRVTGRRKALGPCGGCHAAGSTE